MIIDDMPNLNIEKVLPILSEMEVERRSKVKLFCILLFLGIFFCGSFIFIIVGEFSSSILLNYAINNDDTIFGIYILALVIGILLIIKALKLKKDFLTKVKQNCMDSALSTFDKLYTYSHIKWLGNHSLLSTAITCDDLKNSQLFGDFSHMRTDDEFEGYYKTVSFKISEIQLLKLQQTSSGKGFTTVFKGVVICFNVYKCIKNRTIIAMKNDLISRNSWRLGLIQICFVLPIFITLFLTFNIWVAVSSLFILSAIVMFIYRDKVKLKKINIEDTKFSKIFNIYSSDEVEARYFLTTAFAERLKDLKTAFGTSKIKCTQEGNKFMIAISSKKDLFEIGSIFQHLNDKKALYNIYKQLSSIYNIVDAFKFDEKTGL